MHFLHTHLVAKDIQGGCRDFGEVGTNNQGRLGDGPKTKVKPLLVMCELIVANKLGRTLVCVEDILVTDTLHSPTCQDR